MTTSATTLPGDSAATAVPAAGPPPTLGYLWSFLGPVIPGLRMVLPAVFLLGLANLAAGVYMPLLNKHLVDALQFGQRSVFRHQAVVLVVLVACQLVIGFGYRYATAWLNEALHAGLRRRVLDAILEKPLSFFRRFQVGDLISRATTDTEVLKGFFSNVVLQIALDLLTLAAVGVILLSMNVTLALITVATGPVSIVIGALFQSPIQRNNHTVRARTGALMARMQAWIAHPLALKANLLEPVVRTAFGDKNAALRSAALRLQVIEAIATVIAGTILATPTLAVFVVGGAMVLKGDLTIGSLVAFTAYSGYFQVPLQRTIATFVSSLPGMAANCGRLREVLGVEPEATTPVRQIGAVAGLAVTDLKVELGEGAGAIQVPRFTASRGEIVGIIGPNGCGKTTLLTAILALRPVSSGRIMIELRDGRVAPLHRGICSFLPQESVILDGTLRANMTGFVDVPDEPRLREIAAALGISRWIESLPQGLDTVVDAGMVGYFSGGQLQQIALARAIYRGDPLLALDEPGTSLDDSALENAAQLIRAQRERVVIVVSHRQEILRVCDRVYEFDKSPSLGEACFELREVARSAPGAVARREGGAS